MLKSNLIFVITRKVATIVTKLVTCVPVNLSIRYQHNSHYQPIKNMYIIYRESDNMIV